jgi:hypothetical protein
LKRVSSDSCVNFVLLPSQNNPQAGFIWIVIVWILCTKN